MGGDHHPLLLSEFPGIQDFECEKVGHSNGRACALCRDIIVALI